MWNIVNKKRTICEVLREIWYLTEDKEIKCRLEEAMTMAKKMSNKLFQYKGDWDKQMWGENKDFADDVKRRAS